MSHFAVQVLSAAGRRVENSTFELTPSHEQAERICGVLREFLQDRPPEFRDKLTFLTRGDLELEWSASSGGVAFAAIYSGAEPAAFLLLLSGQDQDADRGMLEGFAGSLVEPLLGKIEAPGERPLLMMVLPGDSPELLPLLQLLATALASVYFRALNKKV